MQGSGAGSSRWRYCLRLSFAGKSASLDSWNGKHLAIAICDGAHPVVEITAHMRALRMPDSMEPLTIAAASLAADQFCGETFSVAGIPL